MNAPMMAPTMVCSLLLAGLANAQQQPVSTAPAGYLSTAGSDQAWLIPIAIFNVNPPEMVQLDDTLQGTPRTIQAIHLRMAPGVEGPSAQNLVVSMRMAHGDSTQLTPGSRQPIDAALIGSWTTVIAPQTVAFPDLSSPSAQSPTPWTIRLQLDQPFQYSGNGGLFTHLAIWEPSGALFRGYVLDGTGNVGTLSGMEVQGPGCSVPGGEMRLASTVRMPNDPTMSPSVEVVVSPDPGPSSPLIVVFGPQQATVNMGFCVPLFVDPMTAESALITVRSNFPSAIGSEFYNVPYSPQLLNTPLFLQAFGVNAATGRVAGSNGVRITFPARPTPPAVWGALLFGRGNGSFATDATFSAGFSTILGIE